MSGRVTLPTRRESRRTGGAEVKRKVAGAVCGVTASIGATQPMLQLVILLAVPESPQPLQCPGALMVEVIVIAAGIVAARTADRLMPKAIKTPSSTTNRRRCEDMGVSMAPGRRRHKRPHKAVTLRRGSISRRWQLRPFAEPK